MGYKLNGCDTGGLPMYLIKNLIDRFDIPYFVETGTAAGGSIRTAAPHFKYCWTIELIEGRAEIDHSLENVIWLTGDSENVLLPVVNNFIAEKNALQIEGQDSIYKYVMFWLDSHYSDPTPNTSKYKECPLLQELEIISGYQDSAIIFIDDARLFMGHPPAPNNPKDWPTIQEIFCLLKEKFQFNYSTITDDYIISLPERLREPIDEEWRSRYSIRYPSHEDSIKQQTKNVWEEFKKYIYDI